MTDFLQPKPIETDAEYDSALQEIERLFNAEPGTPEAKKLETLSSLVEMYEDNNYSLPQPSLIARLLYKLESRSFFPNWIRK